MSNWIATAADAGSAPLPSAATAAVAAAPQHSGLLAAAPHQHQPPVGRYTQPCRRAISFDTGLPDPAVRLGAASVFASAAGLWLRHLLRTDTTVHTLRQLLTASGGRNWRSLLLALLRAAGLLLAAMLGYCPLGRLALGRPLRRRMQQLISRLQQPPQARSPRQALSVFGTAILHALRSPAGLAVTVALAGLPRVLQVLQRLPSASVAASVGRVLLETIGTMLASASATAALSLARPQHLVPSNPWRPEPAGAPVRRLDHVTYSQPHGGDASPASLNGNGFGVVNNQQDSQQGHERGRPLPMGPVGVLVCNLGTTMSPEPHHVRDFLEPFLSDPRVVEIRAAVWQTVLKLLILPRRKYTSGQLYRRLFDAVKSDGKPPLIYFSEGLVQGLQPQLGHNYRVTLGMRYGEPSIQQGIQQLKQQGCERIVVFTAYPQYSGTTSASIYDEVFAQLSAYRHVPTVRVVPPYYAHPAYITALAAVTKAALDAQQPKAEALIISFHGIPERYHLRGDPYPFHCEATAHALAAALDLPGEQWFMSYQSVFGRDPWLLPATDQTVEYLAAERGIKHLAIVCPSFLSDCLETVDENGQENRKIFVENGGETLLVIPCLNADPDWCKAAAYIIREEAAGWVEEL